VNFNTNGLFGGAYDGAIRISSNDPDEGVKLVPTHLTAVVPRTWPRSRRRWTSVRCTSG